MSNVNANEHDHEKSLVCPRCHNNYVPRLYALSRRDNITHICGACGVREAMEDNGLLEAWNGDRYWITIPESSRLGCGL